MTKPIIKNVVLPFSGFYESQHSNAIDTEIEQAFSDSRGCSIRYNLVNALDYGAIYNDYAAEYVENFSNEFSIKMKFESLQSPKEYNFTTDRIFAAIELKELKRLFKACDKTKFEKLAKQNFTSRDGFSSFYSPNYKTWGRIETWDHNQLAVIIECVYVDYCESIHFDNDIYYFESDLMESSRCGFISGLIDQHSSNISRLYDINRYLNEREDRIDNNYGYIVRYRLNQKPLLIRININNVAMYSFKLGECFVKDKPPFINNEYELITDLTGQLLAA